MGLKNHALHNQASKWASNDVNVVQWLFPRIRESAVASGLLPSRTSRSKVPTKSSVFLGPILPVH